MQSLGLEIDESALLAGVGCCQSWTTSSSRYASPSAKSLKDLGLVPMMVWVQGESTRISSPMSYFMSPNLSMSQ